MGAGLLTDEEGAALVRRCNQQLGSVEGRAARARVGSPRIKALGARPEDVRGGHREQSTTVFEKKLHKKVRCNVSTVGEDAAEVDEEHGETRSTEI